jgi:hypothetical protein
MDHFRDLEMDTRTVVNHKNYKIVKESIVWIFDFLAKRIKHWKLTVPTIF